ncbi:MAG TPA: PilZ domain-containing protein [Phycisphaerales bacterium]|nr:PilZ domain-containing protein [Phycisphaerales bacterium]
MRPLPHDNRRAFGRLSQAGMWTDHGPALDISRGGLRIQSKCKLEGLVLIQMMDHVGTFPVRVRVAWCRRIGFRRFEAGLEFLEADLETALRITQMATTFATANAA